MPTFEFVHPADGPAPMGPYSPGVVSPTIVLTAGQLPLDPATGEVPSDDIRDQARLCFKNLETVLREAGSSLRNVVKLTVYLRRMEDLVSVADVRREYWDPPHPVSTTVEVSALPKPDALIEIDAIALP